MSRRERLLTQLLIAPRSPEIDARKRRFDELNAFVQPRGGWLTSVPGAVEVTIECPPGSSLPRDLRERGYDLREAGVGERILHSAIVERFGRGPGGELDLLTPGSSRAVVHTTTHAGIVKTLRYWFDL